jgi:undecaprenyl-diphosphatase
VNPSLLEAIVLGIVQGLAEFLPISSSGHLILVPWLLGWQEHGLTFDLALHLGTSAALLGYFWRDWVKLIQVVAVGIFSKPARLFPEWKLAWLILLGCLPAGIIGVVFEAQIEALFRQPVLIAVMLIGFGLLMLAADRLGSQKRSLSGIGPGVTLMDAVVIGCAQVLALMPGVSRSGITLTAGLFRGLDRGSAARFSFLLSAPITIAAALYKLRDLVKAPPSGGELLVFAAGVVTAGIVGALAIGFLLKYLQRKPVDVFVWYRVAAGLLILALVFVGR